MECYFIGIGGIGMSALALLALEKGYKVYGSEFSPNSLCKMLESKGAVIHQGSCADAVKKGMKVIFSTAVKGDHPEKLQAEKLSLPLLHRSKFLQELMADRRQIVISGSHGKTTTASLAAFLFHEIGVDASFAIGGELLPKRVNAYLGSSEYFIIEGDESDGSFLSTDPEYAILTSVEVDHLDNWESEENLLQACKTFIGKSRFVVWNYENPFLKDIQPAGISVGFSKGADFQILQWEQKATSIEFAFSFFGKKQYEWKLPLIGKHNLLNASLVIALLLHLKKDKAKLRKALASFKGVCRRLEHKGQIMGVDLYDDYAHHPTEVVATLQALKKAYPYRRIVTVFQPHRVSRLQYFWKEFLLAFDQTDLLFVTDIYTAGEKPTPNVCGERLAKELGACFFPLKDLVANLIPSIRPHDIICLMGAGDITHYAKDFLSHLKEVKPLQIGLLCGGRSKEHEISLESADHVYEHLSRELYQTSCLLIDKKGSWSSIERPLSNTKEPIKNLLSHLQAMDLVIPILHGPCGEDGMVQGVLETLGIPYTGCDYRSSAIAMQKGWAKAVVKEEGILTTPFLSFPIHRWKEEKEKCLSEIKSNFSYPMYVKAAHLGSSIGVYRVTDERELEEALEEVFSLDSFLIVEEEVQGRQIEFAIFGNETISIPDPGEILSEGKFYDFESKYGVDAVEAVPNARLPREWIEEGKRSAKRVYQILECKGFARIDFFVDSQGNFLFNEINPIPGCREKSIYPMIWIKEKGSFSDHLDDLIAAALSVNRQTK